MKILIIALLTSFCLTATAQNSRWMYLCTATNKTIFLVDTLKDDAQHVSYYDGHANVCILWFNNFEKDTTTNIVTNTRIRCAIDTINRQMRLLSFYQYKNGNMTVSSSAYNAWADIIPESIGETYLRYVKALNNPELRLKFILIALSSPDNHPFGITP